ncbi:MAG: FAD-dependent oxidoreductase [Myxococcales bacterium]|nr:FAD-dependent oxidoreductase [Myxococcales bacterium]
MSEIVIIGGGLAGLTAALRLSDPHRVTLLEARPRLGGQILTHREAGHVIERGAEGFVFRSEAVPKLAADLGIGDELMGQAVMTSMGFDGQQLRTLAPGEAATFLGFQVPKDDLGKGIRTMRRGMGSLIDALAAAVEARATVRLGRAVEALELAGPGARLTLEGGERIDAVQVLIATAARPAGLLLEPLFGELASAVAAGKTLSSVTVELAFAREALDHPLDATGFVVALEAQQHGLRACTFSTSKFADRAAQGRVSVRLFFRPTAEELETLDDAAWVARAMAGLRRVIAVTGEPDASWVSRWGNALPAFDEAHHSAVAALEAAMEPGPLWLAGSAFHGSGIDAAVRSGEQAAARIAGRLSDS